MRHLADEHLVKNQGEAVDIRSRIEIGVPDGLLGTHVHRRPDRRSGAGQGFTARSVEGSRDAEIGHHRVAVREENVVGLDVTVNHAVTVRVVQGCRDPAGNPKRVLQRQAVFTHQFPTDDPLSQALSLDVRHDVIQQPVDLTGVVQREDIGMSELRGEVDFAKKAVCADRRG